LGRTAFRGIILHLALDSQIVEPQAFAYLDLMLLLIAGAHGGHAFAVYTGHHTLHASGHHQAGTHEQSPQGHGRISDELPIHMSILCKNGRHSYPVSFRGDDSAC
jgi:hypothetical protein